jgi:glycosyltransferase involved in cell wall biosynthesis
LNFDPHSSALNRISHLLDSRPIVLTTVPYYLPGFKGGGKLVTVRNLVAALNPHFRFKVLTADRDLGEEQPYPGIAANRWIAKDACEALYSDARSVSTRAICGILNRTAYDILHLNTLFSRPFGIAPLLLRKMGLLQRRPTIVAPRGELSPGALAIKPRRKRSFLTMARRFGLCEGVIWQASTALEASDIRAIFGARCEVTVAADLPSSEYSQCTSGQYRKCRGHLDIVFLSRITPKKNLDVAIQILRTISDDVTFRILGPIGENDYWARCQKLILALPRNVTTEYSGPIAISEVGNALSRNGLLFLPTASENFGYVVLEAMLVGCPILISDQTPWRDLATKGIGWDLPLNRPDLFREAIQEVIAMDESTHRAMAIRAREFALDYIANDDSAIRNAAMFNRALAGRPTPSPI